MKSIILAIGIVVSIAIIGLILYVSLREKEKFSEVDCWSTIYRPCCRNCAYWERTDDGAYMMGWCRKCNCPEKADYCCMDYNGLDSVIGDGNIIMDSEEDTEEEDE